MNWNARSAWVYSPGELPDVEKARRYGIWYLYLDPTDARIKESVAHVQQAGLFPCLYVAWNWSGYDGSAGGFARMASTYANKYLPSGSAVMLDIEVHNQAWITDALKIWRTMQPNRPTALTTEPLQGGYVPYDVLATRGIEYYPQLYYGDMDSPRQPDPARVVLEPSRYGFDSRHVHPLYDGRKADVSEGGQWDGCYYTLERMP